MNRGKTSFAKRIFSSALLGMVCLVFSSSPLWATTLVNKTFQERVLQAGLIVEAEVVSQHSESSKNNKTIYTFVEFSPTAKALKGQIKGHNFKLRFEGGEYEGSRLEIPGMPSFEIGEKVILFIKEEAKNRTICPLVNWLGGKFTIFTDMESGEEIILDGLGQPVLGFDAETGDLMTKPARPPAHAVPIPRDPEQDKLVSYDSFPVQNNAKMRPVSPSEFRELIQQILTESGYKDENINPKQIKFPGLGSETLEEYEYEPVAPPEAGR